MGRLLDLALTAGAAAQGDASARDRPVTGPVVRLRLLLEADDGHRVQAILAIPRARYDGLKVLELFERHRLAGSSRVVEIRDLEAGAR